MDSLTKSHFKKMYDSDEDESYWVRTKLLGTKNHPKDSQDLRKGGVIPYGENEFGVDSGLWLELFLKLLNTKTKNPNIFQMPMYGKKFRKNLHKKQKGKETYFYAKKVGHTLVGGMMPKVNTILHKIFNVVLKKWRLEFLDPQFMFLGRILIEI